ncbi:SpvB/TcaC N-terminal domain-containing protein [Streptomyces pseudovenezuelae]|uniref:RHS repeat-associated protein n=1 Tax=Streptomyces pseudovenezuelae TaxID=67350 RepID=A0ABT6M2R0_9ACTN|nr:SpvB/TcaC N-terminal domain-containing protein [Streptomyces pseudovenezuelae]MDH6222813.1 RHS repeat-associated protein [Streptomyces pseudovenezuelae]
MSTEGTTDTTAAGSVISLPKGGGAVSGLGEKFSPDLFTGTGNFSVPLAVPAGRHGVQPQLTLAYSTGSGNGPFGLGWELGLAGVSRKTSRGLPRYVDAAGAAPASGAADDRADVFVLSGAEDLVPVEGTYPGRMRYRPRTEGMFARIEHVKDATGDFWEVRTKDGSRTRYGTPRPAAAPDGWLDPAVTADPEVPGHVFAWRITEATDPLGNLVRYSYLRDRGQEPGHTWDRPLLARISYADYGDRADPAFLVTVDFDYSTRPDPFSDHRAGFEVRTSLRCDTVRVTTHAADGVARVAREYRLGYQQATFNGASLLAAVTCVGIDESAPATGTGSGTPGTGDTGTGAGDGPGGPAPADGPAGPPEESIAPAAASASGPAVEAASVTAVESLPPLAFRYSVFAPATRRFEPVTGPGLPTAALSGPTHALVDLRGTGLPDMVELGAAQRVWRNAGNGRFELPRTLTEAPPFSLGVAGASFMDADGDGRPDLIVSQAGTPAGARAAGGGGPAGYFPMTFAGGWSRRSFQRYRQAPSVDLSDPSVKLVDLDGDGLTDLLRSGSRLEAWFNDRDPQLAWQRTAVSNGTGPGVDLADPRVRFADMTGDGLQDLVLLGNGNISYWPNLGRNRWGAKVTMRDSPRLPDGYDPRRVLLGDVDGDGAADLVYVDRGRVSLWGNRSGNAWTAQPVTVNGTPGVVDSDSVQLSDLYGTGMAGLLFSRAAGTQGRGGANLRFLDFSGGTKPYLLTGMDNNLGAITQVTYAPSTREYLRDQADPATRWRTTLPFPVQVVTKVEVTDQISGGRLSTEYRYHHGYWDGVEREFRGFAMVEHLDTETFGAAPTGPGSVPAEHYSPPTLTKSWFHPGPVAAIEAGDWTELDLRHEYWAGDAPMLPRPATQAAFLAALPRGARRAALRTLRGQVLRTELYALDGTARKALPYTVTESVSGVREESAATSAGAEDVDRQRIFFPFALGSRTTQWERGTEPMTQFAFPTGYDAYGFATGQIAVAVPRGRDSLAAAPTGAPVQPYLATYTTTDYARRDDADHYLVDRVARTTGYEVVNDGLLPVADLRAAVLGGQGQTAGSAVSLRMIGHARTFYDGDAFVGLPLGTLGEYGLATRAESLAFTDAFLDSLYAANDPLAVGPRPVYLAPGGVTSWPAEYPKEFRGLLPSLAGYTHHTDTDVPGSPGGYYVTTARHRYDVHVPGRVPRGLPVASLDPLGAQSVIDYDAHDLLPVLAVDPAGLRQTAVYDYRILRARQVTDPNGNTSDVTYSPSGLVTAHFVRGKGGEGDLDAPSTVMVHDLLAFPARGEPASVRSVRRVHHDTDTTVPAAERDGVIVSVEFSDGFGRVLQSRAQAEDTLFGDPVFGGVIPAGDLAPVGDTVGRTRASSDPDNVIVSGWQVYDNKGRVVQQYEPFFSTGYDHAQPLDTQRGQKSTMFYDPRGQVVRTVHPDGGEQRVVFGVPADLTDPDGHAPTPWESYTYDPNDNAGRTHPGTATAYQGHWNTPASAEFDALGRTVRAIVRNGATADSRFTTTSAYDIQGNLVSVTDPLGRVAFTHSYDLAKRCWRTDGIDAGRRDNVPDALGRPVESRDSKGALTLGAFDLPQRPTRVWARDGKGGAVTLRQLVEYADGGTPDQPAAERAAARSLNLLGRPVRHHDEAGLVTVTAVDFKGNVLESARRVIADAPVLATYTAAAADGWRVAPFQVDWTPAAGQVQAARDAVLLEPAGYVSTTGYDALGRIVSHLFPADVEGRRREMRPAYNRAGALEAVSVDGVTYVQRLAYDARGQRALVAYGNGIMTRYAYDPRTFRLTRMRSEPYTPAAGPTYRPVGAAVQDHGYDYDLVGNIVAVRDRAPGSGIPGNPDALGAADPALRALLGSGDALDRRFAYDPVYRLLSATGREYQAPAAGDPWLDVPRGTDATKTQAYTETYDYDPAGNLLTLAHASAGGFSRAFTGTTGGNRLQRMTVGNTPYDYTFDANGNMLTETSSRHFGWNHADRLTAFATQTGGAEPSVHAQYLYDATGRRVKKLVRRQGGSVEVTHYLDETFEHHRWATGTPRAGQNNHVHVMDDRQRVALVRFGPAHPEDLGPATAHHLPDHLGSSTAVLDATGALTNREEYTPYGETSFGSHTRKRYRFTGQERDEESGLGHHHARFYAPWLARWTSCDPLVSAHGASSYCYVSNKPTGLVDPDGADDRKPSAQGGSGGTSVNVAAGPAGPVPEDDIPYQRGISGFFESIAVGGRGAAGNRRYDSLGADQTFARGLMDKGWGCTLCHITTQVWNTWGPRGVNAANNLPLDWTINTEGFARFVALSVFSRAIVESALGAKAMVDGFSGSGRSRQPTTPNRPAPSTPAPQPPVATIRYTGAMASAPSDAQFLRFNVEWAQTEGGPLVRGQRLPDDGALRRTARNHMDQTGFDRSGRQAMHPLDSVANRYLTPNGPVGTTYYFGDGSVNASFGSQLGNELRRLGVRPGDSFTVRFVGFPDYNTVRPLAPPSSPPNLRGHR